MHFQIGDAPLSAKSALMSQRFDLTMRDATRNVSARSIRVYERLRRVEVLIDQRRNLPHIVHAIGDGFEVLVATDSSRKARRFAYDLAGW